ncbi:hypothetical protein [Candidatus Ichthyocystis hellenicum]|uniref:hypothetical protein n=1 Tax=Candidatus Ichthyocystis hellenicum TaxID=1561003 RepID=UPI000B8113AF|nr:hypothetical protein [Candidatus Ichthyocystis hellenicum]
MKPYSSSTSLNSSKIEEATNTTEIVGAASCSDSPNTSALPPLPDSKTPSSSSQSSSSVKTEESQRIVVIETLAAKSRVQKAKSFNSRRLPKPMFPKQTRRSISLNEELYLENTTTLSNESSTASLSESLSPDKSSGSSQLLSLSSDVEPKPIVAIRTTSDKSKEKKGGNTRQLSLPIFSSQSKRSSNESGEYDQDYPSSSTSKTTGKSGTHNRLSWNIFSSKKDAKQKSPTKEISASTYTTQKYTATETSMNLSLSNRIKLCHKKAKDISNLVSVIIFLRSELYLSYKKFSNSPVLEHINPEELSNLSILLEISGSSLSKYPDETLEDIISKIESQLKEVEYYSYISKIKPETSSVEEEADSTISEKDSSSFYEVDSIVDLCANCYFKGEAKDTEEVSTMTTEDNTSASVSELENTICLYLPELTEHCNSITEAAVNCRNSMISLAERIVYLITGINTQDTDKCTSHINECRELTTTINTMTKGQAEIYARKRATPGENVIAGIHLHQPSYKKLFLSKLATAKPPSQTSCLAKTLSGMNCVVSSLHDWKNNETIELTSSNIGANLIIDHSYAECTFSLIAKIINKKSGKIMGKEFVGGITIETSFVTDKK